MHRKIRLFLISLLAIMMFIACKETEGFAQETPHIISDSASQFSPSPVVATPIPTILEEEAEEEKTPLQETTGDTEKSKDTGNFEVHFIDVGQGDAILVVCDGEAMLIDGGDPDASDILFSYFKRYNLKSIRYIVATHPDEDHIGGLTGALKYLEKQNSLNMLQRVYCSAEESDTVRFIKFKKALKAASISLTIPGKNESILLGSSLVQFLNTGANYVDNENNNSLLVKVTYHETSFLFAADIQSSAEMDIVYDPSRCRALHADVLKVAHHGSRGSSCQDFLTAVEPKIAIISVGKNNSYNHPHEETLERLRENNVSYYRTDLCGDIIIKSDGKNLSLDFEKNPSHK